MDPRTRLIRTDRVVEERVASSRVLLDPDNGRHYALDEPSGRIWDLCDGGCEVGEVIAILQDELETVERDVRRALGELLAEKLLLVATAPEEQPAPSARRS